MKETKKKVYKTEVMQFTLHPLKLMEFTEQKSLIFNSIEIFHNHVRKRNENYNHKE